MGYTHYWTETKKPKTIPSEAVFVIKKIVAEAHKKGIIQRDFDDTRRPIVTDKEIRFNGIGGDGHETFCYSVDDNYKIGNGNFFSFCKTAQKPYDEIVMKTLIVLKWALGGAFRVASDGLFEKEWRGVREKMLKEHNIRTYIRHTLEAR